MSGKGLVKCTLGFGYAAGGSTQEEIVVIYNDYIVGEFDRLIVCDSAVPITVDIPEALGGGRVLEIANINTGLVTVSAYGADVINGESTQSVYQDCCMDIKDAIINMSGSMEGYWVII
jgi:hypothetical protein